MEPGEEHVCFELDGALVHGDPAMSPATRDALAQVIAAARARFDADTARPLAGATVRCTYDWPLEASQRGVGPPGVDDVLVTDRGQLYVILAARPVRRRTRAHLGERMAYELLRVEPADHRRAYDQAVAAGRRVEGLAWHGRARR